MSANPELQEKLRNFIEECGSQTKAAKALGKSAATLSTYLNRSEERRVGKECRIGCRSRWSPYH